MCNSNAYMTNMSIQWASSVYSLYRIPVTKNYINFTYGQNQFPRMINNKANILLTRTMVMSALRDLKIPDNFLKSLGLTIKEMLISCTFNSIECSANDFIWFYDTYYGNCFIFNATDRGRISQSGKFNEQWNKSPKIMVYIYLFLMRPSQLIHFQMALMLVLVKRLIYW